MLTLTAHHTATIVQILDLSFCQLGFVPLGWNKASGITQLIHAAVMCALVIVRFTWQSLRMYKATKQWQLNQFINLFVMEGVLYFILYVFISSHLASLLPPPFTSVPHANSDFP